MKYDLTKFVDCRTPDRVVFDMVERERKLRTAKKITQRRLAMLSGVSYASIRRFESKGEISLSSLISIAHVLGALDSFDELFRRALPTSLEDIEL